MASKLRKAMYFVIDHWQLPALIVVIVVGWLLFRRWKTPDARGAMREVQDELDIIRAGATAREMEIQIGTEQTVQQVKDKYAAKTVALNATQMLKMKELEDDPVALARYLERLTRG